MDATPDTPAAFPQLPLDTWRDIMSYLHRADLAAVAALCSINRELRGLRASWLAGADLVIASGEATLEDRLACRVHGLVRINESEVRLYRLGLCVARIRSLRNRYEYDHIEYNQLSDVHSHMYTLIYDNQWMLCRCRLSRSLESKRNDDLSGYDSFSECPVRWASQYRNGTISRPDGRMQKCIAGPKPLLAWYRKQGL
jgi:hypothetical protein